MQADALAENKRLLYVGLTRARDINVAFFHFQETHHAQRYGYHSTSTRADFHR